MEKIMQYINISELKKLAKKERKNNPSIKNHSDSLDIIAKRYGYESWTQLLDSSRIVIGNDNINEELLNREKLLFKGPDGKIYTYCKNENEYIYDNDSKLSLIESDHNEERILIDAIQQYNNEVRNFKRLLKYDENEELYSYISDRFFMSHYENTGDIMWRNRARILARVACYVFRVSKLEKTFENLRKLFSLEFLLTNVVENNLKSDKRVIDFLQTILYKEDIQNNKNYNLNQDHFQQSGFLSMQLSESFSIWATFLKTFKSTKSNLHLINSIIAKEHETKFSLYMAKKYMNRKNISFHELCIIHEKNNGEFNENTLINVQKYFEQEVDMV